MRFIRVLSVLSVMASLAAVASGAAIARSDNVEVVFTVRSEGAKPPQREYSLVVSPGKSRAVAQKIRVPVQTGQHKTQSADGEIVPVASFSYQVIGFDAEVVAKVGSNDGKIRIEGVLSDERLLDAPVAGAQPTGESTTLSFAVATTPGEPVRIGKVTGKNGVVTFEVTARWIGEDGVRRASAPRRTESPGSPVRPSRESGSGAREP